MLREDTKTKPESILGLMVSMILFDFYGVFMPDPYDNWLHANGLERTGVFADIASQVDRGEITKQLFFEKLSREIGRPVDTFELSGITPSVDPNIVATARQLSGRYSLGLLSNASPELRNKLIKLNLIDLFDHLFISSEMKMNKPNPEIFQAVLNTTSFQPEEVIFIDDKAANVQAAHLLGIPSILYTDSISLKESLVAVGVKS